MNELQPIQLSVIQLLTLKDELKALEKELRWKQELLKNACHHPEEVQRRRRPQDEMPVLKTCDICGFEEYIV